LCVLFVTDFTFLLELISGTKWFSWNSFLVPSDQWEERRRGEGGKERSREERQWCLRILFLPWLQLLFITKNLVEQEFCKVLLITL